MPAVTEYDNSLTDFVERVRMAFDKAFNPFPSEDIISAWVTDVFEDHVVVRRGEDYYEVTFTQSGDALMFAPQADWRKVRLSYVAAETQQEPDRLLLQEYHVHEFGGKFPSVPTYGHVNTELLYQNDSDPFHIVLPLARVGEVSANGMLYDQDVVSEIQSQMQGKGGMRGHLPTAQRDSAFPLEDVDWIGDVMVGDTLWGKAYVPPGANREEMRRRKARGGKISTSIYGPYAKRETLGNGTWRPKGLTLESIDLGPDTRAALKLGGEFAIVSEFESEEVAMRDKQQLLAELTAEDAALISDAAKQAILSDQTTLVAELQQQKTDHEKVIAELQGQVADYARRTFDHTLDASIAEAVKVEALRPVVRRAVLAELNGEADPDKAQKVLSEYTQGDEYKALAGALVRELAGPSAIVSGKGQNWRNEMAINAEKRAKETGVL